MNKRKSIVKTSFNVIAILFILYLGWITYKYGIMRDSALAKGDTIYTIATVTKIEGSSSGGLEANFSVSVNKEKYEGFFMIGKTENVSIGNRYYYLCLVSDIGYGKILLDQPVPDSIKASPSKGWIVLP